MSERPRGGPGLWIYVGAVIAAAAAALTVSVIRLETLPPPWLLALFVSLALPLELMVVPIAGGGGAAASFAVYFAGVFVLGPVVTALASVVVTVFADGLVRRTRAARLSFNAAHGALSLLATGWVYQRLGGVVDELVLARDWPAVVGAWLCLWGLETGWVLAAVVLERGERALGWLRASVPQMLTLDAALASVGLLLALLYESRAELAGKAGWQGTLLLVAIAAVPSGLLYYAYRLQGHLHEVYANSLRALGTLVEAKVEAGRPGHGGRVADLAASLARALDVPLREVEQIRYAGFLHDIGKVAVPSSVLARDRDRYAGEAEPQRMHPRIGEQILSPIRFLQPAARMVRAHHERWDGLGYPDGLRGEEIPLGARLLSIADAHVSLSEALGPEEALARLQEGAGSRFDPRLLELLTEMLNGKAEPAAAPERRARAA